MHIKSNRGTIEVEKGQNWDQMFTIDVLAQVSPYSKMDRSPLSSSISLSSSESMRYDRSARNE